MSIDPLHAHARALSYCASCPKMCRFACPVALASGSEADTPTAKATVARDVAAGRLPLTPERAAVFYRCSQCHHARTHCEHRIDPADYLQAARVLAVRAGMEPAPVRRLSRRLRDCGSAFGPDLLAAAEAVVPARLRNADAPVVYFPGCVALTHRPDLVRATIRVLESLHVRFAVYARGDACNGFPALAGGDLGTFRRLAARQSAGLRRYSTILTSCPTCADTFARRYPEHGFPLAGKVAHITEFLLAHVSALPVRREPKRVAVLDACALGRGRGTYEAPRVLLTRVLGAAPVEFARNRADAGCCGAGGLLPRTNRALAEAIGRTRWAEFSGLDADALATSCPSCARWLARLAPEREVRDVVEWVGLPG